MAAVLAPAIRVKRLGTVDYLCALEAMRAFTAQRGNATDDELWLLEHPSVYTLGFAADPAHGPRVDNGIPVIQVERGGEITYHGPCWKAVITEGTGQTVITRYELKDVLDKLEALDAEGGGGIARLAITIACSDMREVLDDDVGSSLIL